MSYGTDNLQTLNWVKSYFDIKFDLEGQGQPSLTTIEILTKFLYTSGLNFMILALTVHESLRRQAWWWMDGLTDGHTQRQDAGNDIPGGQNWPRVKTSQIFCLTPLPYLWPWSLRQSLLPVPFQFGPKCHQSVDSYSCYQLEAAKYPWIMNQVPCGIIILWISFHYHSVAWCWSTISFH